MALKLPFKLNKWVLITDAVISIFPLYHICTSLTSSKKTPISNLTSKKTTLSDSNSQLSLIQNPSPGVVALQNSHQTNISNFKTPMNYTEDTKYINSLWSSSMGWKFRNDVIVAPKNDPVWNNKAEQIRAIANKKRSKRIYNYWNKEYLKESQINGEKIHALCTSILYQNDRGLWMTYFSGLNHRFFFDFVWKICGREDKIKPQAWKFNRVWR